MAVKVTERTMKAAVLLRRKDTLLYELTVGGDQPTFVLVDDKGRVLMSSDGSPPQAKYTRDWPLAGDAVDPVNQHVMALSFVAAVNYSYKVTHRPIEGPPVTLIDADYESQQPEGKWFVPLGVNVVKG